MYGNLLAKRRKHMSKSVRVCPKCSKLNIKKLKEVVGEENVNIGCVGACRRDRNYYFGRINGVYIMTETEEEFIKECEWKLIWKYVI